MRWLFLLLLLPAPASAQCRLSGTVNETPIRIRPAGAEPFLVDLADHEVTATFVEGRRTRIRSDGPLVWVATAGAAEVPIALARMAAVVPLTLRPGVPVLRGTQRGAQMRVTLELMHEVTVTLGLPCRVLRLGATAEPAEGVPEGAVERGTLLSATSRLSVHSVRGGAGSVRIHIGGDPIRFAELDRRGGWVQIRRDFFNGSTVLGWVRERDVRVVEDAEIRGVLMGTGSGLRGMCLRGGSHIYVGPASLRRGSAVLDSEGGTAWAWARADVGVRVYFRYDAEWVQIEQLPGLLARGECPNRLERAWVRRSNIHVPRIDDPAESASE